MSKKVIFHLVYSFDTIGGLENGIINIVNNTDPNDFKHIICSLTTIGRIRYRITNNSVTYYFLNKKYGNNIFLPCMIYKILQKEAPDVVHLRNWPTMVEGFVAAKLARVRSIIYSEHGRHFESVWQNKTTKTLIIRFILQRVSSCICVSSRVATEMKELYKLTRGIEVIRNGVDMCRFSPLSPEKKKIGLGRKIVIGSVGRLEKGKKFDELIVDFLRNFKNGNLIIVGDGPERAYLENVIKDNGGRSRIRLAGNRDDVPYMLNSFDIFVLPSESEGLSNAVMEAMSCGIPIVAYDVGGTSEMVVNSKGGFLVNIGDRQGFINAITTIINDIQLMESMAKFNRQRIEEFFSINKMVSHYVSIYTGEV